MRALLNYARRLNKLYPDPPSRGETALDAALRRGLDDFASPPEGETEAEKILNRDRYFKSTRRLWGDATDYYQTDVQRAILLLEAEDDRTFRLDEHKGAITDEGVARVMKEVPYFPPKRGSPRFNFNGKVHFVDNPRKKIYCRHFVEHRQSVQERTPYLKFNHRHVSSEKTIRAQLSFETEARYLDLEAHAETHLLRNCDFGKALAQQFAGMEEEGQSSRLIALGSTKHVMSVGLRIKEEDGQPRYSVTFFDPGSTTSHVRAASDSLRTLEALDLRKFIASDLRYSNYYSNGDDISIMFVRPSVQERTVPDPARIPNREFKTRIPDCEIGPTAVLHMLASGFGGELRRLKTTMANRPKEDLVELLAAKGADGAHGLFWALRYGHADAIAAFGELLKLLPEEMHSQIPKLVAAENGKGRFGFVKALQKGHLEALKAFGDLLSVLTPQERAQLRASAEPDLSNVLQSAPDTLREAFDALHF